MLAAEPDVALYAADRPFPGKQGWVNALIARMGYDRWYLTSTPTSGWSSTARRPPAGRGAASPSSSASPRPAASAGCAPCSSTSTRRARSSRRRRGNQRSRRRRGPLLAPEARDLLFDADGYAEALCLERVSRKGGPRRRAFGFDPELTKYPLFHIRAGEVVSSPHHLHPYRENYRSDCLLGLLHDKFGPGWRAKAERAAAEGNYWRRASSTARRWPRSPATPASRSPTPAAGATARPPTSSPPG